MAETTENTGKVLITRPLGVRVQRGKGRRARLTYDAMIKMQAHYEHGTKSQRELARDYGIDAAMIGRYAKRDGWAPFGSKKAEAMQAAAGSIAEQTAKAYADVVKEVNERHLMMFRGAGAVAAGLLKDVEARAKWVRALNAANDLKASSTVPPQPLPKPVSTGNEAIVVERIVNALKAALIDGERFILGLAEGALEKDDPTHGAKQIVKVLEQARAEFGDKLLESQEEIE